MPNDCELITLVGDIDDTCVDDLWTEVEAFRDSSAVNAVVDLSDATSLGTEALGFVARLVELAHRRGGRVTLINSSDADVRVVDLCGMRVFVHRERHYSIPRPRMAEELVLA